MPELLAALEGRPGGGGGAPSGGNDEAAALRVLQVAVLRELGEGGGPFSSQVAAVLAASPVWAAHAGRQDLYMPEGGTSSAIVGLLTGPGAAQFALPAPES